MRSGDVASSALPFSVATKRPRAGEAISPALLSAMRMLRSIYYNVGTIFKIAKRDGITTWKAADRMAEERINTVGKVKLPYMGSTRPLFKGRSKN